MQHLRRHILGSSQILCENCAAQILHNLCKLFGVAANVSQKFSGTSRDDPAYKIGTIFSDTWHVKNLPLYRQIMSQHYSITIAPLTFLGSLEQCG